VTSSVADATLRSVRCGLFSTNENLKYECVYSLLNISYQRFSLNDTQNSMYTLNELEKKKCNELKDILRERGSTLNGKKQELIARIVSLGLVSSDFRID
jgi:hypothetical protein